MSKVCKWAASSNATLRSNLAVPAQRAALTKPRLCLGIVRAPRPNIRPAMQPRIRSAGSTAAPFSKLTGAGRLTLFCFSFTGGYA